MKKYSQYWNKYYLNNASPSYPSNFAKYCSKKLLNKNSNILEVGCGNGRDSLYFSKRVKHVTCVDRSKNAIKIINNIKINNQILNLLTINGDVKTLYELFNKKKYNVIYMRWFLHSIEISKENYLLNLISKLKYKPIIAIEARTSEDNIISDKFTKKISNLELVSNGNHYRRLLDKNEFIKKLAKLDFKILYKRESKNFSKLKISNSNENPSLIRFFIQKK